LTNRVGDIREYDWDRARSPPQRSNRRGGLGIEHVGPERHQLRGMVIEQSRIAAAAPTPFDAKIAALSPIKCAKALEQGSGERLPDGVVHAITHDYSKAAHIFGLQRRREA
jgi:hypothetical protein